MNRTTFKPKYYEISTVSTDKLGTKVRGKRVSPNYSRTKRRHDYDTVYSSDMAKFYGFDTKTKNGMKHFNNKSSRWTYKLTKIK